MTEELLGRGDPVIRRLQQAFVHEDPTTELAAILQRAAHYQAGGRPAAPDPPRPSHGLTEADLVAARRREPAALTRVYAAYAPALSRYFLAAVGDRRLAEDLTGTTFASAIEALPRFRGPVDTLGGWLFQIARHDLYDHRRRQGRSRVEPLEDNLGEAAAAASASGLLGRESGIETAFWSDQLTHPALGRLSAREREILGQLAKGWSNRRIAEECFLSLNTVRTHVQNILVKLGVHSKLEAVAGALEQARTSGPEGLDPLAMGQLEDTQVVAALQHLPPDQREVLVLSMVAGLTAPEVATALGKTIGAVKALRHRGLASLAGVLGLQSSGQPQEHPSLLDPDHLASQEGHQG
jgi:RNA polymerase sigma factor (sigma-70 family)